METSCKLRASSEDAVLELENRISDPEHVPGSSQRRGRMRQDHLRGTTPASMTAKEGAQRPHPSQNQPMAGRLRHDPCRRILPSSPSPQYGDHARRAAARDPRGGGIPMTRPSQPEFRQSPLALSALRVFALGEVVSNTRAENRLKSLDFRSHGDRPRTVPVFVQSRR